MCESVPVAQSVGEERGRKNREGRENKHWKHGHEQNPAGAGAELPRGHLWDCSDPQGHQMEPDTTTAVYKSRQSRRRQQAKASTVGLRP